MVEADTLHQGPDNPFYTAMEVKRKFQGKPKDNRDCRIMGHEGV